MTFVNINTTLVRTVSGDLTDVAQLISQSIQTATDAQTALRSYESAERAPQIKALLVQWLDEAPLIMQRVQQFSQFLDGVATTYESIR
jgi:hypothetical protein